MTWPSLRTLGPILAFVVAEQTEWPLETWTRRTRFTAVVSLFAVSIALFVVLPGVGDWLSGVLTIVAGLWYWLPVALRTGRKFAETYQSESLDLSPAPLCVLAHVACCDFVTGPSRT